MENTNHSVPDIFQDLFDSFSPNEITKMNSILSQISSTLQTEPQLIPNGDKGVKTIQEVQHYVEAYLNNN